MGGSLKNVLAIASGISDGLGFGSNARAALITRGLDELCRLAGEVAALSYRGALSRIPHSDRSVAHLTPSFISTVCSIMRRQPLDSSRIERGGGSHPDLLRRSEQKPHCGSPPRKRRVPGRHHEEHERGC
jgi:hypothetical protein